MSDPTLEMVLPEAATLTSIRSDLLLPGRLPGLWPGETTSSAMPSAGPSPSPQTELRVGDILAYFAGGHVVKVDVGGWSEPLSIPAAPSDVVEKAIGELVRSGKLWLLSGVASIMGESIPAGVLTDASILRLPPEPILAMNVLPPNLPEAWPGKETTALAIASALSQRIGVTLPWITVREAIDGAIRAGYLELTVDSGQWPCGLAGAGAVRLKVREAVPVPPPIDPVPVPEPEQGRKVAEAELQAHQVQDLADVVSELVEAAIDVELRIRVRIELGGERPISEEVVERVNGVLAKVAGELKIRE
jgi:hypothetical protein